MMRTSASGSSLSVVTRSRTLTLGRRSLAKRLCMVVHGPYPVGEPRVARETRAALDAEWEVDVVAMRRHGELPSETVAGADVHRLPLEHTRGAGVTRLAAEYAGFAALASARVARLARTRRYSVVQVHAPPDFLVAS